MSYLDTYLGQLDAALEELERQAGQKVVVDFVRAEKGKVTSGAAVAPEPKLAAETMAVETEDAEQQVRGYAGGRAAGAEGVSLPSNTSSAPNLEALKPRQGIAIARMNRFTNKVQELGA